MKIAFYGSSLVSSYWNGAATYYRGMLRQLAARGYDISFFEPDAFDRQAHRDIGPPPWARSIVYPATLDGVRQAIEQGGDADILVKASGVGVFDDELVQAISTGGSPHALRLFWDVDAAATLTQIARGESPVLHYAIPKFDMVLTYGGGDAVIAAYRTLGARDCHPIYNALDPDTHFPVAPVTRFEADLAFLGNRLPDREARVDEFFFRAAQYAPDQRFLIGGSGWADRAMPGNVRALGHVGTVDHNAFNSTPRAVLNVARDSMAHIGFSPATRIFEAAGAGACIITDAWEGIETFLKPDTEILVARDGRDVADHLRTLTPERARAIGEAARARVLADHSYSGRADQLDRILRRHFQTVRNVA